MRKFWHTHSKERNGKDVFYAQQIMGDYDPCGNFGGSV